ncbi:MAG: hypothetical protein QOC83_3114, partial [Pseudonocardiales bacterium]|nr:hypothetical protein [Pseudonocardiales bacterium]
GPGAAENEGASRGIWHPGTLPSAPVTFRWRYLDDAGEQTTGPDESFSDQAEAESWFTDVWPELLDDGVHAVTLLDGDAEVYGPMSLHEQG